MKYLKETSSQKICRILALLPSAIRLPTPAPIPFMARDNAEVVREMIRE